MLFGDDSMFGQIHEQTGRQHRGGGRAIRNGGSEMGVICSGVVNRV